MSINLPKFSFNKLFQEYLSSNGVSSGSVKYYISDINHFSGWIIFKLRSFGVSANSFEECLPFLSSKFSKEYLTFLIQNTTSAKTVNRRLSTLRHLSRFLILSQIMDSDFMEGVQNVALSLRISLDPIIIDFQKHLESEKVSKNTIKNYLSDIKHFLSWIQNNQSMPVSN